MAGATSLCDVRYVARRADNAAMLASFDCRHIAAERGGAVSVAAGSSHSLSERGSE